VPELVDFEFEIETLPLVDELLSLLLTVVAGPIPDA